MSRLYSWSRYVLRMTLGSPRDLDVRIQEVEQYGYKRSYFPLLWNGHHIVLLNNRARDIDNDRIHLNLGVYCINCHHTESIRGAIEKMHPIQIQTVKLIPLEYYWFNECT